MGQQKEEEERPGENVWEQLLSQVGQGERIGGKNLLLVGSPGAGKRALLKRLSKIELENAYQRQQRTMQPEDLAEYLGSKNVSIAGLGYSYLEPEIEGETSVKVNAWFLDDIERADALLDAAIPDFETLKSTAVVIVVDLSKPWKAIETLEGWASKVKSVVEKVSTASKATDINEIYSAIESYIQYTKLSNGNPSKLSELIKSPAHGENEEPIASIGKDVLTNNIGIPVMVVGTKGDVITNAAEDPETELRLEFIQKHIRKFCLSVGASVTYTSALSEKNIGVFYSYLLHRLFPLHVPLGQLDHQTGSAQEEEKEKKDQGLGNYICSIRDIVHVPAGWDSAELVNSLATTTNQQLVSWSPDASFESVVTAPKVGNENEPSLNVVDSEQDNALPHQEFLAKLLAKQKLLPDATRAQSTDAAAAALKSFNAAASSLKTGISDAPATPAASGKIKGPGGKDGSTPAPGSARHTVTAQDAKENPALIANFFQNLLNRDKTSGSDK